MWDTASRWDTNNANDVQCTTPPSGNASPPKAQKFRRRIEELADEFENLAIEFQTLQDRTAKEQASWDADASDDLPVDSAESIRSCSKEQIAGQITNLSTEDTVNLLKSLEVGHNVGQKTGREGSHWDNGMGKRRSYLERKDLQKICRPDFLVVNDSKVEDFGVVRRFLQGRDQTARGTIGNSTHQLEINDQKIRRIRKNIGAYFHDLDSRPRLAFESLIILLLFYDSVLVPFTLAWKPELNIEMRIFGAFACCCWWADLFLNFVTPYYTDATIVTEPGKIAWRYLTRTFFFDMLINSMDSVATFMEFHAQGEKDNTSLRAFRLAKLSRLARVMVVFNKYRKRVQTPSRPSGLSSVVGLGLKLVAILFLLNHMMCCIWYWIGDNVSDTSLSWLDMEVQADGLRYRSASKTFQYTTSLHWSFTQMTPGSMSVVPQNSYERLYNVLCLLIGLFVGAILISQLSAQMVRIQTNNHAFNSQMEDLNRFFLENSIHRHLSGYVVKIINDKAAVTKSISIKDLPFLASLPQQLRQELHCLVYGKSIITHTLFHAWSVSEASIPQEMAYTAADLQFFPVADDVFVPVQDASNCFYLRRGNFLHENLIHQVEGRQTKFTDRCSMSAPAFFDKRLSGTGASGDESTDNKLAIPVGSWVSMAALFCIWTYRGRLQAENSSEVVRYSVEKTIKIVKKHPLIFQYTKNYALAFCGILVTKEAEGDPVIDLDLDTDSIYMHIGHEARTYFSCAVLSTFSSRPCVFMEKFFAQRRLQISRESVEKLEEEIINGTCFVSLGSDMLPRRTVQLVVLSLRRNDSILTRIATRKHGKLVKECVLPGSKFEKGESPQHAAERVFAHELPSLEGSCIFKQSTVTCEKVWSKQFNLPSAYLKTEFDLECIMSPGEILSWESEGCVSLDDVGTRSTHNSGVWRETCRKMVDGDRTKDILDHVKVMPVLTGENKEFYYAWITAKVRTILTDPEKEVDIQSWFERIASNVSSGAIRHSKPDGMTNVIEYATSGSGVVKHSRASASSKHSTVSADVPDIISQKPLSTTPRVPRFSDVNFATG